MKTINEKFINEIEIKNSRFITILVNINDTTNISEIIKQIKIDYPKATHYCYAYVTENYQKASDDGEPGGTAGIPMLNVLLKENMVNILAIVIRYFGGIKLGAGGLVRAYTKSVKEALDNANTISVVRGYKVKICTSYNEQKNLDYVLRNFEVINKEYQEKITYFALIPNDELSIIDNFEYSILNEEYIKRN